MERGDITGDCDGVNSVVRAALWVDAHGTVSGHIALTGNRGKV